ncbi:MAG: hypothetical protein FWC40_01300 [Proteobacteria bacterium]|nr:hypothetical protein [Pseudomonadota bacterium]
MESKASPSTPYIDNQNSELKALEHSIAFARDRDYIIIALQNALKNKQFQEAHNIVETYREAGKADKVFEILADKADECIATRRDAAPYIALLQATPDDDYTERAALCQKIIEIIPEDAKAYRDELERCGATLAKHGETVTAQPNDTALCCSSCKLQNNAPYTLGRKKPIPELSIALGATIIVVGIPCYILYNFFPKAALVIFTLIAVALFIITLGGLTETHLVCRTCLPKFTPVKPKNNPKAHPRLPRDDL